MNRIICFTLAFLCSLMISIIKLPIEVAEVSNTTSTIINKENVSAGYFTVNYPYTKSKMKVGVTYKNSTTYHNYTSGHTSSYALTKGNGTYTITLYKNVVGYSYKKITSTTIAVKIKNNFAPYLISTDEITFSKTDSVGKRAAKICSGLTSDAKKVKAIQKYMVSNFKYDYALANKIKNGEIASYVPNTRSVLKAKKGICYDLSALYAAMCRSQGIPCTIKKGYVNGTYHAWNKVYINGKWKKVDITASIAKKSASTISVKYVFNDKK